MIDFTLIYIVTTIVMVVCFSWVIWAYTTKMGTVKPIFKPLTSEYDKPNPNVLTPEQLQYLAEEIIQGDPITAYEREVTRLWDNRNKDRTTLSINQLQDQLELSSDPNEIRFLSRAIDLRFRKLQNEKTT